MGHRFDANVISVRDSSVKKLYENLNALFTLYKFKSITNHGVFTYSVLDAFDKNQRLKVNVLSDHVTELVPKITQEKFHFEQRPQVKLNQNFVLSSDK